MTDPDDGQSQARALTYRVLAEDLGAHAERDPRSQQQIEDVLGRLWSRADSDAIQTRQRSPQPASSAGRSSFIGVQPRPWDERAPIGEKIRWFVTEIVRLAVNIDRATRPRDSAAPQPAAPRPGAVLDEVGKVLRDEPFLQRLYAEGRLTQTNEALVANLDRSDRPVRNEGPLAAKERELALTTENLKLHQAALLRSPSGAGSDDPLARLGNPVEVQMDRTRAQSLAGDIAGFAEFSRYAENLPRTAGYQTMLYDRRDMVAADNFPKNPVTDMTVMHRPNFAASDTRSRTPDRMPMPMAGLSRPPSPRRR